MRAACRFARKLRDIGLLEQVSRVSVELYGSLALTGMGHATDRAILLGLCGEEPATVDPERMDGLVETIRQRQRLLLDGEREIAFDEARDLRWERETLIPPGARTQHPNGMRLRAWNSAGAMLREEIVFSIGGGFLMEDGETSAQKTAATSALPFPFSNALELLENARQAGLSVDQLMLANECALSGISKVEVEQRIRHIWSVMQSCMKRGMATEGILPGGLKVRRRAHRLAAKLEAVQAGSTPDPLAALDWLTVYAMAVNEENAAGGRVVTAPTNGAAGVVPAVAQYYLRFVPGADEAGLLRFFLTSAAIGILYKENASISGAEVGCQGEVGVACSMAAAGLVAAQSGTNGEVEHAAEIAMEHNLGMTCDPIGGLVQIPCIERNAMASAKAVHAARIAMQEPEEHKVSLDQVIRTMYLTGLDMQSRYKETSLGGLALNNIEC
jgi:L-serine dehydratase